MGKEEEKGEGMTINTVIKNGRSTLSLTIQTTTTKASSSALPERKKNLALMMLGCESNPPYGPNEKVATIFLQLMSSAIKKQSPSCTVVSSITITIYDAEKKEYPQNDAEWDLYDGILIPGSHSSVCDDRIEWIRQLKDIIHQYIHEKRRKTLGVCFGHQVLAHALSRCGNETGGDEGNTTTDGLVVPCPSGSQWGRKCGVLTDEGKELLSSLVSRQDEEKEQVMREQREVRTNDEDDGLLHLLDTHGDMVQRLPPFAVALSGTDIVPIQSAAYFFSVEEAASFREISRHRKSNNKETTTTTTTLSSSPLVVDACHRPRPYAISFQSHPEYASERGFNETFPAVLNKSTTTGGCSKEEAQVAMEDAVMHFNLVRRHSVEVMMVVGREFGWW